MKRFKDIVGCIGWAEFYIKPEVSGSNPGKGGGMFFFFFLQITSAKSHWQNISVVFFNHLYLQYSCLAFLIIFIYNICVWHILSLNLQSILTIKLGKCIVGPEAQIIPFEIIIHPFQSIICLIIQTLSNAVCKYPMLK